MVVTAQFRQDGLGPFQKNMNEMPERVRANSMQRYLLVMFTATEQIFVNRFLAGFTPKKRSWADSWDPVVGRLVYHGSDPLVRTGLLFRSLTESDAKYAIRKMGHKTGTFGTSRPFVYKGALNPNLARVLNEGSTPKSARVRVPKGMMKLRWEPMAGFVVTTSHSTSDQGANIPSRPFLFDRKPLTSEERAKLDQVATQFWTRFFEHRGAM